MPLGVLVDGVGLDASFARWLQLDLRREAN